MPAWWPDLKQRLNERFPLIVAAVVPLAGVAMAAIKASQRENSEATALLLAAVLGTLIWVLVLTL